MGENCCEAADLIWTKVLSLAKNLTRSFLIKEKLRAVGCAMPYIKNVTNE
jgi:hypothetical protein